MRPLYLKISAFGPYSGITEIDMTKLGSNGIYLITGDTGAGKTTIFDAICFALFGKPSGDIRESSMLRSKYAKAEVPTEVELVFEDKGKCYKLRRNPEYMRPAKRGDGETRQAAGAELIMPDGTVITKEKSVTEKVIEIIGVDRNRFTQIAMIAQGEFLKLLNADTKDRQKIFRDIFKTGYYQELQDKLKDEANSLIRKYENVKSSITQYIDGIVAGGDSIFREELECKRVNALNFGESIELIDKILNEDSRLENSLRQELSENEAELSKFKEQKLKLSEYEKLCTEYKQNVESLRAYEEREKLLLDELKKNKDREHIAEQKQGQIARIELLYPDYDNLEELSKKLSTSSDILRTNENKKTENERLENRFKEDILNLKEELTRLQNVGEEKQKLLNDIRVIKDRLSGIAEINALICELKQLDIKLARAKADYLEASALAQHKQEEYLRLNKAFLDDQAGVLAASLVDGIACPVCGSTSHPCKAELKNESPTQKAVNKAREYSEQAVAEATKKSENANALKGRAEAVKEAVFSKLDEADRKKQLIDIEKMLLNKKKECEDKLSISETRLKAIEKSILRNQQLNKLIPEKEKTLENIRLIINTAEKNISSELSNIEQFRQQIEKLKSRLEFADKNSAKEAVNNIKNEINKIKSDIENAKRLFDECEEKINIIRGRISEQKKVMADRPDGNLDEISSKIFSYEEQKTAIIKQGKEVHARIVQNKTIRNHIENRLDDIIKIENKLSLVKSLSDTANGNLSGKERIMLETYIQTNYFDRIIERANTRLMIMSNGRYDLKRRETSSNLRSQSGLELNVIDHYNGTERSVKTLSGGESFMASLALALGLSDEVMSLAGGIRLDTMFVDEGFGSLDEESLKQAIKALSALADGNRLVGIISHVSELKEKINNQIVVKKDRSGGSSVEIVCG
ncbi:MAG: SMC family ATPase [Eubacteriales bacterium]|nr:SMC family ATPase [Eubacteriales bacterium]